VVPSDTCVRQGPQSIKGRGGDLELEPLIHSDAAYCIITLALVFLICVFSGNICCRTVWMNFRLTCYQRVIVCFLLGKDSVSSG